MTNVELLRIEPTISSELAAAIRTNIKSGSISERFERIVPLLRKSVAYYTYADYGRSGIMLTQKHTDLANAYLEQVVAILNAAPDTYTEFKNSASYNADRVSNMKYDNKVDSGIFVFGG
jgi:hypothetical protein